MCHQLPNMEDGLGLLLEPGWVPEKHPDPSHSILLRHAPLLWAELVRGSLYSKTITQTMPELP